MNTACFYYSLPVLVVFLLLECGTHSSNSCSSVQLDKIVSSSLNWQTLWIGYLNPSVAPKKGDELWTAVAVFEWGLFITAVATWKQCLTPETIFRCPRTVTDDSSINQLVILIKSVTKNHCSKCTVVCHQHHHTLHPSSSSTTHQWLHSMSFNKQSKPRLLFFLIIHQFN